MPDFKNSWTPMLTRLKTRLGMKAPSVGRAAPENSAQVREALQGQNQRLERVRRQVAKEEKRLEALRAKLSEARKEALSSTLLGEGAPVFFLTGRAKSGTSWLMRILDSHPEVLCKGEGLFFGRDYTRNKFDGEQVKIQRRSLYGVLADSEYLRTWIERSVWTQDDDAEEHLTNITSLATNYFLKKSLSETNKKFVGDKTPFTGTQFISEVAQICPHAKLIHIVRDGRDVAISSMHHIWNNAKHEGGIHDLTPAELETRDAYRADPQAFLKSGRSIFAGRHLAGTAKNWAEMVGRARQDGPQLLGENYAEVRYEDLLEHPEEEVGRLLRFLGADASDEAVRLCVEGGSFERWSKGRERGREDSRAFLRKGVAGDWRSVVTEEDKRVFKEAAGETLIELGYEKDDNW
jgi:hypothetical protein